ncbi:hypothetical protein [Shewanella ulleungensis]|uniref:hypothetical protein n=1 Tax=Shewanella ulleungensis TaxID=2282699 RepID=UPI003D7B3744
MNVLVIIRILHIYIANNIELYDTHINLGNTEKLSSIESCILSTFEYLKEICNDDGQISEVCVSVDFNRQDEFSALPIADISFLKRILYDVSLIFIEAHIDASKEKTLTKIIDFYDKNCFEESDYFIENYIQLVKLVNTNPNIDNNIILSINEKAIEWYEQVREYAPEQWYELERDHKDNIDLRRECFYCVSITLLEKYKLLKPTEIIHLCLRLLDIGFEFDIFEDDNGITLFQEIFKTIAGSEQTTDISVYRILSNLIEKYFINLLPSLKLRKVINKNDFIVALELVYFNYVLPYTTANFTSDDNGYIDKYHSVGSYLEADSNYIDPYSTTLSQLSLILLLRRKR